jgi:hypothetical protein
VIQGNFHRFVGTKAVGSSGHHSDFVVETLDGATGDFALGPKPVQEQLLMRAERPGDLAHRLDAAAQSPPGPKVQKVAGVPDRLVGPKVFEEVFEHPGARRFQLHEFDHDAACHPPKKCIIDRRHS